jgi:hypothetical protein
MRGVRLRTSLSAPRPIQTSRGIPRPSQHTHLERVQTHGLLRGPARSNSWAALVEGQRAIEGC